MGKSLGHCLFSVPLRLLGAVLFCFASFVSLLGLDFQDKGFLCIADCPETFCMDQAVLKLMEILLLCSQSTGIKGIHHSTQPET